MFLQASKTVDTQYTFPGLHFDELSAGSEGELVYNKVARDYVTSAMEGGHSAVVSYGKTAFGKIFTLVHILVSAFVIAFQWFSECTSSLHYLSNLDGVVIFTCPIVQNTDPFDILDLLLCFGLSEHTLITFATIGPSE